MSANYGSAVLRAAFGGIHGLGRRRSSLAFTLVELLVVIAIIALLVTILAPAVQRAIASGRGAICYSNARQIGQAMHMHVHDWDGRLPFHGSPEDFGREPAGNPHGWGVQWDVQIMPYLGLEAWEWGSLQPPDELPITRPTVFHCPAVAHHVPDRPAISLGYSYNQHIAQNFRGMRILERIEDPTRTLLVMDAVYHHTEGNYDRANYLGRGRTASIRYTEHSLLTQGIFCYRHNQNTHILFADSHVAPRPMGPEQLPAGVRLTNTGRVFRWPGE